MRKIWTAALVVALILPAAGAARWTMAGSASSSSGRGQAPDSRGDAPVGNPSDSLKPGGGQPPSMRSSQTERERFVKLLFRGFLNREPTREELRYVGADGREDELDRAAYVQMLLDSDEYFVRSLYKGMLGREPDREGLNTFMRSLRSGRSRRDTVDDLLRSEEFLRRLR